MSDINSYRLTVHAAVMPLDGGWTRIDSLFCCVPLVLFTAIVMVV